jgi:tight adherence protein B
MSATVLLLIVVVFAAAYIGVLALFRYNQQRLQRYEQHYLQDKGQKLAELFMDIAPARFMAFSLGAVFVGALLGVFTIGGIVGLLLGGAVGYLLPELYLRRSRSRRLLRFDEQLVEGLATLANSLRSGLNLAQACQVVVDNGTPPISQEFDLLLKEHKLGKPFDDAFEAMARRIGSRNLDLVVTATVIARTTGGNLPEVFKSIEASIREITRLDGMISTMTAQGRLQGLVIGSLPVVFGFVVYQMDPDLILPLFTDPIGNLILAVIVLLQMIGIFFIWKIVNIDV